MWIIVIIIIVIIVADSIIKNQNQVNLQNNVINNFPYQIKSDLGLYQQKFGKINEYHTSYSMVQNCKNNPFKYICKYFDLPVGNDLKTMLKNKIIDYRLVNEANDLRKKIVSDTETFVLQQGAETCNAPLLLRGMFNLGERVIFDRTITEDDLADIYRFRCGGGYGIYSSGNHTDIVLNNETIKRFIDYVDRQTYSISSTKDERDKMTPQLRAQVLARDNYTCQKCGASIYNEPNLLLEVDHIIPVSKGGKTIIDNLQTLCWKCNRQKSNN